jgi:transposase-like protein
MKEAIDLCKLIEKFDSEAKCQEYLEQLRCLDTKSCLKCNSEKIYPILGRNQYLCDSCTYQFSVTVGTIFHDTHLPHSGREWGNVATRRCVGFLLSDSAANNRIS